MLSKLSFGVRAGLGFAIALAATAAQARIIDININESRGADPKVNYSRLTDYGPWDDRNYALTADDLKVLPADEFEARDPLPAFFRVWMRRQAIQDGYPLATSGVAQYPRKAVNIFLAKFKGIQIDGHVYTGITRLDDGRFEVLDEEEFEEMNESWPRFVSGEVKITPPGYEETAIAVNPVDTNIVIAGSNGTGANQIMWRSTNGGATWSSAITLSNSFCDPSVGWSSDGQIAYTTSLFYSGSGGGAVYRSTNAGVTWTQGPTFGTSNSDKEYMHVDFSPTSPYKDNLYIAWHEGNIQKFVRSTDKGLTFGPTLTLDSSYRGIGSDITSDKDGNVYYFFPTSTGARQVRVVKSTDGGASFAAGVKVADTMGQYDFPLPSMPSRRVFMYVSADADLSDGPYANSIYVAWPDTYAADNDNTASANHSRVQVAYSRDGGATWHTSTPHPTSDGQSVDRYQEWLKVDQWGRVHVMYYDTQNSASRNGVDIYYSVSNDGGQTWEPQRRLTTATSPKLNSAMEWGDYQGMDMAMNDIIAIYTDNRSSNGGEVWAIGGFADSPGADYSVAVPSETQLVCAGESITPAQINLSSQAGYIGTVALSLPSLNTSAFSGGTFMPPTVTLPAGGVADSVLTLGTQPSAASGTYPVLVRATDSQATPVVHDASFNVQIVGGVPAAPALSAPANGATGVLPNPTFTWAAVASATSYDIELATDSGFANIVASDTSTTNNWTPTASLGSTTTYYWRVTANNTCGDGVASATFSFTTGGSYTVGGTVNGLDGPGLTLKLNNGAPLAVAQGDASFVFPNSLPTSTAYAVTVGTSASGQTCTVANGTGTIGSQNVTNVVVNCVDLPPVAHVIGGHVHGLTSPGLVLQLNGGLTVTQNTNGVYNFVPGLAPGVDYEILVMTQPTGLECVVSNGTGTMPNYDVSNVDVDCAVPIIDSIFVNGFDLTAP